jgi:hypothetical protein
MPTNFITIQGYPEPIRLNGYVFAIDFVYQPPYESQDEHYLFLDTDSIWSYL